MSIDGTGIEYLDPDLDHSGYGGCLDPFLWSDTAFDSRRAEYVREIDGLFAGMAILEEFFPCQPSPDSREKTLPALIDRAREFLRGLYHAQTGDRLEHYDLGWSYPFTIDGVRNLFKRFAQAEHLNIGDEETAILQNAVFDDSALANLLDDLRIEWETFKLSNHLTAFVGALHWNPDCMTLSCPHISCRADNHPGLSFDGDMLHQHFLDMHHNKHWNPKWESIYDLENPQIPIETEMMHDLALRNPSLEYGEVFIEGLPSSPENAGPGTQQSAKQSRDARLQTLRRLRANCIVQHRRFIRLASDSNSSTIQLLRKAFERHRPLVETGLSTFRDILKNSSPSTLKEVFAFLSVAYAMEDTLKSAQREVEVCVDRRELHYWQGTLHEAQEKAAFETLSILWQRWQERHSPLWPGEQGGSLDDRRGQNRPFSEPLERILSVTASDEALRFGEYLNLGEMTHRLDDSMMLSLAWDSGGSSYNIGMDEVGGSGVEHNSSREDLRKPALVAEETPPLVLTIAILFLACSYYPFNIPILSGGFSLTDIYRLPTRSHRCARFPTIGNRRKGRCRHRHADTICRRYGGVLRDFP